MLAGGGKKGRTAVANTQKSINISFTAIALQAALALESVSKSERILTKNAIAGGERFLVDE